MLRHMLLGKNYVYSLSPLVLLTFLLTFTCLVGGNNARGKSINQSMWVLDTIYTVASLSLAVCDVKMCVAFHGHPKS